jgi:hypothetical protein
VLTGPHIAGLRAYKGEIVGEAAWPAIISHQDRDRLLGVLGTRRRGRPSQYPLSGVLRCGRCGQVMYAAARGGGQRQWRCKTLPGDNGRHCGQLSATAEPIDTLVNESLLLRLDGAAVRRALRKKHGVGNDATVTVANLEQRLIDLGKDQDNGLISRKEWLARRGPLQERLDATRAQLAHPERDEALAQLDGGDIRERWATLSVAQQRAVVALVIDRVVISPPPKRGARFDAERVDVIWRA